MTRDEIEQAMQDSAGADWGNEAHFQKFAALLKDKMIRDGWRQCAKGQRTTQFCALTEEAVKAEREELREANEALRRDAERYRWLTEDHLKQETRGQVYNTTLLFNVRCKEHIDAAIDVAAAIRARGE